MKLVVSDIETNGLHDCDTIWLHGGIEYDVVDGKLIRGETRHFEPFRNNQQKQAAIAWSHSVDLWVGHNFLSFDAPTLNRLLSPNLIPLGRVVDTLIVSRLLCYDRVVPRGCKSGHSLEAHGVRLKMPKGDFHDFENYSQEMVDYWKQDLEITARLLEDWWKYINDPNWKKSMRAEHDLQVNLDEQTARGFLFDRPQAADLLSSVEADMAQLEAEIQEDYPPQLQQVNELNYKINKDGTEGVHVQNAKTKYAMTKVEGDKFVCYDYVAFNPGSPKDRIDKLWEAKWKPFDKTKTHQNFLRTKPGMDWGAVKRMTQEFYDDKKAHFEVYGWTCSEDNLETLPESAPPAARKLAKWLTLEGRRSSLVEWIGQIKEDGRIHGRVWHIGAWTGRCSHSDPNTANISAVWPSKKPVKTAVDEVKYRYDTAMRSCWRVEEDDWLVGVDAEGIQLRILA